MVIIRTIIAVAPLVGAWIEMYQSYSNEGVYLVAPLVGAWIEICTTFNSAFKLSVAPLVGAWIEIEFKKTILSQDFSRSPRGSVD